MSRWRHAASATVLLVLLPPGCCRLDCSLPILFLCQPWPVHTACGPPADRDIPREWFQGTWVTQVRAQFLWDQLSNLLFVSPEVPSPEPAIQVVDCWMHAEWRESEGPKSGRILLGLSRRSALLSLEGHQGPVWLGRLFTAKGSPALEGQMGDKT